VAALSPAMRFAKCRAGGASQSRSDTVLSAKCLERNLFVAKLLQEGCSVNWGLIFGFLIYLEFQFNQSK
jgi:hypothetical protein